MNRKSQPQGAPIALALVFSLSSEEKEKKSVGTKGNPFRRVIWKHIFLALLMALACLLAITAAAADGAAPVHKVDGSFVREWLILGPIPTKDVEIDFLADAGGEANVRPKEGDTVTMRDGTVLKWIRVRSNEPVVNLEKVFGIQEWSVAYAYCELNCDQAIETDLRADCGQPASFWINGTKLGPTPVMYWQFTDIRPVLPIRLNAGTNACLLKLRHEADEWRFDFQPLPPEHATVELQITDSDGRNVAGGLVRFYDQDKPSGRSTTDPSGKVEACFYPVAEKYDLRVTSDDLGTWLFDLALKPGEHRKLDLTLAPAVCISGRVLAMDGSPQNAIVVQAVLVQDFSDSGRADLPVRPDTRAAQQRSPTEGEPTSGAQIQSLLPMPPFSETTHSDTNGFFKFVNLRPGKYRLRCHGPGGYVYPEGAQETDGSEPILVAPRQTHEGIHFVFPEAKKGVWRNYPIKKGLLDLEPKSVHRTPDGMLWIGTDQATLHAYDGVEFKTFSSPDIPGNHVQVLKHDTAGTLWIGSNVGISRKVGERIETLPFSDTLPRKFVRSIQADQDGTLWFGTASGLCRYDGREFVLLTVRDGLPSNVVGPIVRAKDGPLWVATSGGLVQFDGHSFSEPVDLDGFRGTIGKLHQAVDGAIWFCSSDADGGAYRIDGKSVFRLSQAEGLLRDEVYDVAETSDGVLWFATSKGLSKFDGATIVNYTEQDGLSNEGMRAIYVDSDDVLWCANGQGVSRFDPKGIVRFSNRDGLRNGGGATPGVFDIEPDADGSFWIGTEWGEAYRTDGMNFQHIEPAFPISLYVRRIHRTADGTLWFATQAGLFKLEGGKLVRVLDRNWVLALCSDTQGNLWYGHAWTGGGLSRYNPKTGENATFTTAQGLPDNNVWAVERAANGGVWVGTELGLGRHNGVEFEDFRDDVGIPTGTVMNLRRDAEDALWIGSRLGLHRLQGTNRVSVTVTNGLPEHWIWCSARTADGIVWMGTVNNGLLGYDGKTVTVLDKRDGFSGDQPITVTTNADSSLWIGFFDHGLTRYRPTKTRPSIRLIEAKLDDRTITDFSKVHSATVGNRVTVQYQEIDLKTHPEKRQFWYQVKGPSGETIFSSVTKERRFEWTPRERGAYTFEVQAIDRDLNYSEPARLAFRATVPWYASALFIVPSGGTVFGLFVWAFIARSLYARKRREAERLREQLFEQESQARKALERKSAQLEEAKEAAESAREAAETANRAKSEFLANMSHEIRTPLNAVLGYAQILQRDKTLGKDHHQAVGTIERSGSHLLALINDILDLSKIESGRMELSEAEFDLTELMSGLSVMFGLRCRQKGLAWEIEGLGDLPIPVRGDEGKLRQVLINLLGNAVKFTESGSVRLQMRRAEGDDCEFVVEDSGPGISEDAREKLFDPFTQGKAGREKGGTGLGLAISRRCAELMGGTLRLDSALGKGSRFSFTVPLKKGSAEGQARKISGAARVTRLKEGVNIRALVADDVAENRDILRRCLEETRVSVATANDGEAAWKRLSTERFDIAFLDIRMPGMTGLELAERVAGEFGAGHVGLVAVSASTLLHEQKECAEKGFDAFVPKPFRFEQICECLKAVLGDRIEFETEERQEGEKGAQGGTLDLALPAELIGRLRHAAEMYSVTEFESYLGEVESLGEAGAELAGRMRELSRDVMIEEILKLLDQVPFKP